MALTLFYISSIMQHSIRQVNRKSNGGGITITITVVNCNVFYMKSVMSEWSTWSKIASNYSIRSDVLKVNRKTRSMVVDELKCNLQRLFSPFPHYVVFRNGILFHTWFSLANR